MNAQAIFLIVKKLVWSWPMAVWTARRLVKISKTRDDDDFVEIVVSLQAGNLEKAQEHFKALVDRHLPDVTKE